MHIRCPLFVVYCEKNKRMRVQCKEMQQKASFHIFLELLFLTNEFFVLWDKNIIWRIKHLWNKNLFLPNVNRGIIVCGFCWNELILRIHLRMIHFQCVHLKIRMWRVSFFFFLSEILLILNLFAKNWNLVCLMR